MPDGVPLAIKNTPITPNLAVKLGAFGVGVEEKSVAVVIKSIQHYAKGVRIKLIEIPIHVVDYKSPFPTRIKTVHSQIEIRFIVENSDLRSFCAEFTVGGLLLKKIVGGFR